jgi:hypothetical protein
VLSKDHHRSHGASDGHLRRELCVLCGLIAGATLIAMDLPYPTNMAAEGRRIFFTFAGIGIAIVVMFLASLLQKRQARTAKHPQAAAARPA